MNEKEYTEGLSGEASRVERKNKKFNIFDSRLNIVSPVSLYSCSLFTTSTGILKVLV